VFLYLWWRGINLGQSVSYFKDVYRTFLLGMIAMIALIIIWQLSSSSGTFPKPGAGLGANVIAFFFFGLVSIAVCQLYTMRSTMPREEAALTSIWRWMPIMLGVIGGVVLVGFAIASALSPEFFDTVGQGARAIVHFFGHVFSILITPLNYLAEAIMWVLRWLISLLRNNQAQQNMSGNISMPNFGNPTMREISPAWGTAIRWVLIVIVIGVVFFILAKAVSRFRAKRNREDIEEIRESLFSWKGLRDDLKLFLNNLGQRFKRKPAGEPLSHFDENASGKLDIREIYRHLQWEAGKSGIPRRRHETADEYAGRLRRYAPDSSASVDDITRMYKNVRYGETSVPEGQVDNANSLWQTLKELFRKMRGS